MNLFIQSSDAGGDINPIISEALLGFLPCVDTMRNADAVVIPVCFVNHYRFNRALLAIEKPVVILEFLEFGWDAGQKPNVLGTGMLHRFEHLNSEEWALLDEWAGSKQTVTFKRELLERDRTPTRLPIEFPCRLPIPEVQSESEFNARPVEVFSTWGLSHPARQRLHGEIFANAHEKGIHVVDGWDQKSDGRCWATIHTPHYLRKSITEVMRWNQRAKISVSLPGAGVKCFRSAEAPVGSIMALQHDSLAWSFPWKHWENCIRLGEGVEFGDLEFNTRRPDLYGIYRQSQETIARYQSQRYANEYMIPAIKERL